MKIALLGFDNEGRSSYEYFKAQGHELTICDQNEGIEYPEGAATVLGQSYLDDLDRFDVIVRTAGLPIDKIYQANPELSPDKVTSQVNEFFKVCPTKQIIGITGTKGKGTTSTLLTEILKAAGLDVYLGGNIGLPVLRLLADLTEQSWVVLELSSYQLSDLKKSPAMAVCLMVEPEHIDWHGSVAEYVAAKTRLFQFQAETDMAIYYSKNITSQQIAAASAGTKLPYMESPGAEVIDGQVVIDGQKICGVDELKLPGEHNWQNVCAAVTAAWQVTQNVEAIQKVLTTFSGLPYRIELRGEVNGISYYNDSFATGGGAAAAAIRSIPEMKVMIIGGFDRYLDLSPFAKVIKDEESGIRKVLLIGESAGRMAEFLQTGGFDNFTITTSSSMPEIVAAANELAQPGDAVVLSPGFASFDMFKNFEDRGEQFNKAVEAL